MSSVYRSDPEKAKEYTLRAAAMVSAVVHEQWDVAYNLTLEAVQADGTGANTVSALIGLMYATLHLWAEERGVSVEEFLPAWSLSVVAGAEELGDSE